MAVKNSVEAVIAGKVYKLCGFESQEYLHQVAAYLNKKMEELSALESYRHQNADQRRLVLDMNLVDDYFKEKERSDRLSAENEKKDKELYSTRHDLIDAQLELENLKKELSEVKSELEEAKKPVPAAPAGRGGRASQGQSQKR